MKRQKGQGAAAFILVIGVVALLVMAFSAILAPYTASKTPDLVKGLSQISASLHAQERHTSAVRGAECLSNPENVKSVWWNPDTNRYCLVGEDDSGIYLAINEQSGDNVTLFSWKKTWMKLMCYLDGRGYTLCEF